MKKNLLLTFISACVPGCGQMYYGYMRRGVSLAFWFWGIVFLASLIGLGVLTILLPIIWAYAFFDTFNIRSLSPEQRSLFRDDFIPNRQWLHDNKLDKFIKKEKAGTFGGLILIVVGVFILYNTLVSRLYWYFHEYFPLLSDIMDMLPPLLIGGAVVAIGVYLLTGRKKQTPPDDIYPFEEDQSHE